MVRPVPTPGALAGLVLAGSLPCPGGQPVARIDIVRHEIFDARGRALAWPFRLANRLHTLTREDVIRREVLLEQGACLDAEALAQTERNLRRLGFLRDARVDTVVGRTVDTPGVDVRVSTFDTWTTSPELRFAKVGNRVVWTAGVSETNLFGGGHQVQVSRRSDLDRDQTILSLRDSRLGGSRVRGAVSYADRSDGRGAEVELARPFFALGTAWSFGARLEAFDQRDPVYLGAERVADLRHVARRLDLEGARAVRRTPSSALRMHLAYRHRKDDVAGDARRFGVMEAGLSLLQHRFERLTHVNRFERAEDFNLGHQLTAAVGVSTPALGGERGNVVFVSASERKGLDLGPGRFAVAEAGWAGRHRHGRWENAIAHLRLDGLTRLGRRGLLLATARYRHGAHLDPEVQLTLGAHNGLRGYPVHQWVGSRSLLLATEARLFVADDVKQLASFGLAAFTSGGYAWPEGRAMALRDLRGDVGVGLLIGRNRLTANRPGLRVDLAYAFNPAPGRGRWLLSVGSNLGFLD
jgi:hypothetical protein